MRWPYDKDARLIGEHVYEHADIGEVVPVDEADVITFDEARKLLEPLIRPLTSPDCHDIRPWLPAAAATATSSAAGGSAVG
jgi:hypothetical protein